MLCDGRLLLRGGVLSERTLKGVEASVCRAPGDEIALFFLCFLFTLLNRS